MTVWEIVLVALGLSADAFAVAMCKGVEMKKFVLRYALVIALFFGAFQALMPLIGWAVASQFARYIESFDHWIAFALLLLLGGRRILDTFKTDYEEEGGIVLKPGLYTRVLMAVATSIDALSDGVTFPFLKVVHGLRVARLGSASLVLSFLGTDM